MKVYLDPGHGGDDPGATANGIQEKDIALTVGLRTASILRDNGFPVRLSRTTDELAGGDHLDTNQSLEWRAEDANDWGADVFVSIHCNAGGGKGFESYRYNGIAQPSPLQEAVHDAIYRRVAGFADWVEDRGMKAANFAVLRETAMPALLTENLFVDHNDSAELLQGDDFLDLLAEGHAVGIAQLDGGIDMALTDDDLDRIANRVWAKQSNVWPQDSIEQDRLPARRQLHQSRGFAQLGFNRAGRIIRALSRMAETLPDDVREAIQEDLADVVDEEAIAENVLAGLATEGFTPEEVAQEFANAFPPEFAQQVVSALTDQLERGEQS